jgi:hypothetical protein
MTNVSGDKAVVMMVHLKKDGQIWRTEMARNSTKIVYFQPFYYDRVKKDKFRARLLICLFN